VNFTSRRSDEQNDKEEIFDRADYRLLSHESVIAFPKAHAGPAAKLEPLIHSRDFTLLPDLPEPTLERIIAAAKISWHLSPAQKRLLA
jgi:hypothetical protein